MKTLLALLLLAAPAHAGPNYNLSLDASSATLKVGGVMKVADPTTPYTPTITLNGVGGVVTATTLSGALDGSNITAGTVDTAKLATDAVTGVKILNGAIDTAKLAADAVTGVKILNGTIDTAKLNATIQAQLSATGGNHAFTDVANAWGAVQNFIGVPAYFYTKFGTVNSESSMTASGFFGAGDALTGVAHLGANTYTGRQTAPDATLTYGLTAATGSFSGSVGIGLAPTTARLQVENNVADTYAGVFQHVSAAGSGDGVKIIAGGNATDTAFLVQDRTEGTNFLKIDGAGASSFTRSVTASSVTSKGGVLANDFTAFYGLNASTATFSSKIAIGVSAIGTHALRVTSGRTQLQASAEPYALQLGRNDNSDTGFYLGAPDTSIAPSLVFSNNAGTARVTFTDGGSVGIGTASPATTLDVNGNAQFGSGATKSTFTATGFWQPVAKTRAQVDVLVPAAGDASYIDCTDCTLPGLCRSTGTLVAQWRKVESATVGCGTGN